MVGHRHGPPHRTYVRPGLTPSLADRYPRWSSLLGGLYVVAGAAWWLAVGSADSTIADSAVLFVLIAGIAPLGLGLYVGRLWVGLLPVAAIVLGRLASAGLGAGPRADAGSSDLAGFVLVAFAVPAALAGVAVRGLWRTRRARR